MRRFGGHGPVAGGLTRSTLPYLDRTGANTVQFYVSNPRGWSCGPGDPVQDEAFVQACQDRDVAVYIHACLLVNLGSPNPETVRRSGEVLEHALRRGAALGARAVVFHAGSAVGPDRYDEALGQVRETLRPILDAAGEQNLPRLLVEPSAGGGRSLASRVEDLGPYLAAVDQHERLGVCFDTCHAWAAGHDLATPGGMRQTLDELIAATGPDRLDLVHANDSKDPCGSTRDRHENIGAGAIGADAFGELLAHPAVTGVPVIVETPDDDGTGRRQRDPTAAGHRVDLALLRSLLPPPAHPERVLRPRR